MKFDLYEKYNVRMGWGGSKKIVNPHEVAVLLRIKDLHINRITILGNKWVNILARGFVDLAGNDRSFVGCYCNVTPRDIKQYIYDHILCLHL